MKTYPFTYLRGGTSRAVFFKKEHLPLDESQWPEIFLNALGVADPADVFSAAMGPSLPTKKVAVIGPSDRHDADVEYHFFQIDPKYATVDSRGSCGNMASAVGPFAVDEGMVTPEEGERVIRIYHRNTDRIITSHVQVKDGRALVQGDTRIAGVPGTGAPVVLHFEKPGGGYSGKLYPTGNPMDRLELPGHGSVDATIIDCANPVVILRAVDLGLKGNEIDALKTQKELLRKIETARCVAAQILGLVDHWEEASETSTYIPHVVMAAAPQRYTGAHGDDIAAGDMDLCCRAIFTSLHKAYPMAAAIATAAAAKLPGTVITRHGEIETLGNTIRIGHPSGVTNVDITISEAGEVLRGTVLRTARRLFDGMLYMGQA